MLNTAPHRRRRRLCRPRHRLRPPAPHRPAARRLGACGARRRAHRPQRRRRRRLVRADRSPRARDRALGGDARPTPRAPDARRSTPSPRSCRSDDQSFDAAMALGHGAPVARPGAGPARTAPRDARAHRRADLRRRRAGSLLDGRLRARDAGRRAPPLAVDRAAGRGLGGSCEVHTLPIPNDCVDGFSEAFYARPEAFLDPAVRRSQSAWSFVPTTCRRASWRGSAPTSPPASGTGATASGAASRSSKARCAASSAGRRARSGAVLAPALRRAGLAARVDVAAGIRIGDVRRASRPMRPSSRSCGSARL